MCESFSRNDQNKENDGLRRFLILEADSFSDLRRQATAYAELFHPGISGNARFEAGLPIMLATLAGAIGQMGHWDEAKLRIFILRCIKEWDGQLWLFPDGGTFKAALGSHELLRSRPYRGKTVRFRIFNMPPHTGLFTY